MTRRTRIVATLGPSTDGRDTLEAVLRAGVDVTRLSASHSDLDDMRRRLDEVREAAEALGRHVAVMVDLAGPKIRLGHVPEGTRVRDGEAVELAAPAGGEADREGETAGGQGEAGGTEVTRVGIGRDDLWREVRPGDEVYVDDGRVRLVVERSEDGVIHTRVLSGGLLRSEAGVNVPGALLDSPSLTESDVAYARWAVEAGVDALAQSFVRSADDVEALRALVGEDGPIIVAKIEKREALEDVAGIVAAADVVMVARGDLGVETSPEDVPVAQKRIVRECRAAGVPVIIATEMLESMIREPRPTRAEASDVANAVFDAVDAVMLAGETAIGEHPAEAVRTIARILEAAEASANRDIDVPIHVSTERDDVRSAVSAAVVRLAETLDVRAVVTSTRSGGTARAVASHRPAVPVVASTPSAAVARRLAFVWGVVPVVVEQVDRVEDLIRAAVGAVRESGLAKTGELVAVTAGIADPDSTDLLQVLTLD